MAKQFERIKRYELDDVEFVSLKNITKTLFDFGNRGLIMQFMPISSLISISELRNIHKIYNQYKHYLIGQFKYHDKTYEDGVVRDFTDALIEARNEAVRDGKESAPYLTNYSLICSLWDLLFAGVDTTQITVHWMFLLLAKYPVIQTRMRQEIEELIGDRLPEHKDIDNCQYVNAFICETMRFRPVLPFGVLHKTVKEVELGNSHIE
jgi:cytochrome P450